MNRQEHLERLIMGLEMAIPETKSQLTLYKPEDIELIYAKKFLAAQEDSLVKSRAELQTLIQHNKNEKKPSPSA